MLAPDGTMAVDTSPVDRTTSASTVGLLLESRTSRQRTDVIVTPLLTLLINTFHDRFVEIDCSIIDPKISVIIGYGSLAAIVLRSGCLQCLVDSV